VVTAQRQDRAPEPSPAGDDDRVQTLQATVRGFLNTFSDLEREHWQRLKASDIFVMATGHSESPTDFHSQLLPCDIAVTHSRPDSDN
jgi:hypothetical protein